MKTGKIKLDSWNGVAWFMSDKNLGSYKVKNTKFKTEKVFVPACSEALIRKCYIEDQQIQDQQDCKAEVINNMATITQITIGGIPSWKIKERIINL